MIEKKNKINKQNAPISNPVKICFLWHIFEGYNQQFVPSTPPTSNI